MEEGKYYSQDGVTYKCTRSTGQAVYANLSDLIGIYVEVAMRTLPYILICLLLGVIVWMQCNPHDPITAEVRTEMKIKDGCQSLHVVCFTAYGTTINA